MGACASAIAQISAARVNPYLGSELVGADGAQGLHIDPAETYGVYRTPEALRDSVESFENVPLLIDHAPTTAADPKQQLIVGSISNVRWQDPYLVADLMVFDAEAIQGIEDNSKRELSPGYRFTIADAPGTAPDGTPYRFKMTRSTGNHLALCSTARTGHDIFVGDSLEFSIE